MTDPNIYLDKASKLYSEGQNFEKAGQFLEAFNAYRDSAQLMKNSIDYQTNLTTAQQTKEKMAQIISMAEIIKNTKLDITKNAMNNPPKKVQKCPIDENITSKIHILTNNMFIKLGQMI